jgi:predicted ribosome quality control (RQC) complex YloA/Tae2 family protein
MYYSELEQVIGDLQVLVGQPLTGAWQPSRDVFIVGVGNGLFLALVPGGALCRIHTVTQRPKNPASPYSFQGACRVHLKGRLTHFELDPSDRVVTLQFSHGRLVMRMTGRSSGLWLEVEGVLIASLSGPTPAILPDLPIHERLHKEPRFHPVGGEGWDIAAGRWYKSREKRAQHEDRLKNLSRTLSRMEAKGRRLLAALSTDLLKAKRGDTLRSHADLIGVHLHQIPTGVSEVTLPDPMDGHQVSLDLDPRLSAADNMNRLYSRSRKLDRMGRHVLNRLATAEAHLTKIHGWISEIQTADAHRLLQLEGWVLEPIGQAKRVKSRPQHWYTWTGPQRQKIWVGKNETGNKKLLNQKGRGDDIWLHIRGQSGPHVVMPMKRGQSPSLERLLVAGQIAILHAKIAEGEVVDVQYTSLRYVRSIPGDALGRVTVTKERVLQIRKEKSALTLWTRD